MKKLGISLFTIMLILTGCSNDSVTESYELPELGFSVEDTGIYTWMNDYGTTKVGVGYANSDSGETPTFQSILYTEDESFNLMIQATGEYSCEYGRDDFDGIDACEDTYLQMTDSADLLGYADQFYAALSVFENETGVDVKY